MIIGSILIGLILGAGIGTGLVYFKDWKEKKYFKNNEDEIIKKKRNKRRLRMPEKNNNTKSTGEQSKNISQEKLQELQAENQSLRMRHMMANEQEFRYQMVAILSDLNERLSEIRDRIDNLVN